MIILDKNTLYTFSFLFGVIIKIYDDLNDNKLFKYYDFLKKNKKYINNILQCLIVGCLTVLSFQDFMFCFDFTIMNIIFFSIDRNAFSESYEFSGLIMISMLCLFLFFISKQKVTLDLFNKFLIISIISITLLFIDYFILNNAEYGLVKLILRFITLINLIILIVTLFIFNLNKINIISKNLILFGIGYLFTSCIFQFLLLYMKNKKIKNKKQRSK
jgi:hypothetical protein